MLRVSKQRKKRSQDARITTSETLAKWRQLGANPIRISKGSKRGCIGGKGGPENLSCSTEELGRGFGGNGWLKFANRLQLIKENGHAEVRLWLGTFPTAIKAARAYDEAARVFYSPSAILNFPDNRNISNGSSSTELDVLHQ